MVIVDDSVMIVVTIDEFCGSIALTGLLFVGDFGTLITGASLCEIMVTIGLLGINFVPLFNGVVFKLTEFGLLLSISNITGGFEPVLTDSIVFSLTCVTLLGDLALLFINAVLTLIVAGRLLSMLKITGGFGLLFTASGFMTGKFILLLTSSRITGDFELSLSSMTSGVEPSYTEPGLLTGDLAVLFIVGAFTEILLLTMGGFEVFSRRLLASLSKSECLMGAIGGVDLLRSFVDLRTCLTTGGGGLCSRRRSDSARRSWTVTFSLPSEREPRRFSEQCGGASSSRPEQLDKSSSSSSSWTILHFLARYNKNNFFIFCINCFSLSRFLQ